MVKEGSSSHCPQCGRPLADEAFCGGCSFPLRLVGGRYRVEQHLAKGGFGELYVALDILKGSRCVVKFLRDSAAADGAQKIRFQREIRVTSRLAEENPFVVQVFDQGEEPALGLYYAMERLRGETLMKRLLSQQSLSSGWVFALFRQLCDAVGRAHEQGVIHRDLKPANLFICREGGGEDTWLKILDFGLAKELQDAVDSSITNGAIGTLRYMPPEQWSNWDAGTAADIYAMGVVLYELLTRKPIFDDVELTRFALGRAHLHLRPKPLSLCRADIDYPQGLGEALAKALEKHPARRYDTPAAFWAAVAPFADVEFAIQAPEVPPPSKFEATSEISDATLFPAVLKPISR